MTSSVVSLDFLNDCYKALYKNMVYFVSFVHYCFLDG